jgi:hypothetical protein
MTVSGRCTFQLLAWDDRVEHALFEQELGALEAIEL